MRYHHTLSPGFDTASERYQFQCLQPLKCMGDGGQCQVRVYGGITMTREMLETREDARCVKSLDHCRTEPGNQARLFAKRTHTNNGVGRIVIDINHRGQDHIDDERSEFTSCCQSDLVRIILRTDSS